MVKLTAEFMGLYFNLEVKFKEDMPLSVIPESARRTHPTWGDKQLLTRHILEKTLYPKLPKDAAAYIAFTTSDLWPGEGWNFVFGEAVLRGRVGVWSIYRFGNPEKSEASFRLCLLRTIKLAAHETGHMFSMQHCIMYLCNMCGSNNLPETDRHPLALCPECMAKVCWMTNCNPVERYKKLSAFCKEHGLDEEHAFYEKSIKALE